MHTSTRIAAIALALGCGLEAHGEGGRTLEGLKAETQARADRNAYPLIGLKPGDVRDRPAHARRRHAKGRSGCIRAAATWAATARRGPIP